jgi:hypothetical protein
VSSSPWVNLKHTGDIENTRCRIPAAAVARSSVPSRQDQASLARSSPTVVSDQIFGFDVQQLVDLDALDGVCRARRNPTQ